MFFIMNCRIKLLSVLNIQKGNRNAKETCLLLTLKFGTNSVKIFVKTIEVFRDVIR